MPKRGPSPAERQEQERKLQQQTLAQANQVKARGGNLTAAQKQALLQEQNRQKELQRQQQAAIAAKKAADEAAAMAEAQKNPKLLQPEQPATIGPAQQDELAVRGDQMVRMEPPEQRINLDQFIARERRPVTANPLRLGPLEQFNSMQQQMYQTEPAEPQPEITHPVQKQEEPKIPAQQTTQAKQQEQQPVQPIKRQMVKRRM